ncbi:TPA: hypothetical protein I9Y63_003164 [Legionella pneumophila]|nr:hypothetical protein [Legionella pneumophila]
MRDYWDQTPTNSTTDAVSVVGFLDEGLLDSFVGIVGRTDKKFQWLDF